MYILGINCVYHESSAAILKDGRLIAAVEEERFNRVKHGKPAEIDNPDVLPIQAIEYCLEQAGIKIDEVEWVACSFLPENRLDNAKHADFVEAGGWGSEDGEKFFYDKINQIPDKLMQMGFHGEFKWISHHLSHAASSYYGSPFEEAAILVVDGIGESASTMFAIGKGERLLVKEEINYPNSIGFLWEKMCKYLGFSEYDACKLMGLATYGRADDKIIAALNKIVHILPDGKFSIDNNIMKFRIEDYSELENSFNTKRRGANEQVTAVHQNIAYALQKVTEKILLHMIRYFKISTGMDNLCLAGGVALNCVANGSIVEEGLYADLYIHMAAHDAGTAVGAAQLVWHEHLNHTPRFEITHPYYGPSFSDTQYELALQQAGLTYERKDSIEKYVAQLLCEQKIIGWFQGAMEFGPRALGNRSLIADPRSPEMRDKINLIVKHREDFRPFAPSILADQLHEWYEVSHACSASDFMLVNYSSKYPEKTPAIVHIDGTSRVQTVKPEINKRYYQLIHEFALLTGVPMILNTSFNDNEPIVCTPQNAVNTFLKSNIDCLVMGDFVAFK
ncbi:carbamoyl transferase [Paenibacillus sp. KS1]|uniref:carbamoyltransferase family protein n=1 Tax=Paenibacillus sp. KS1 TaxID=1849249 RepID=UPI000806523A|nr:carbamoyltransferase C-terminal domain-containing protein [Paenibacillus sp. KS1]OBY78856.1 carbamoyl transferase [Paenibacillus sp. KS1]